MRVKIRKNIRSTEINKSFLVTQKISEAILGSNAIKYLLQNKTGIKTALSVLQTAFNNVDKSKMKTFVELIQKIENNCS